MFMEHKKRLQNFLMMQRKKAPTIIFIDEVDAILPNREGN
jgi:ATP-dependent 26S proteasome regulatory subunit